MNKLKRDEEEAGNNATTEDVEAMKAELEKLQLDMKKMKAKESVEMNRLKEVIRRQERTITTLKSGSTKGDNAAPGEDGGVVSKSKKTPSRQALVDRSSKQNSQEKQPLSSSKAKTSRGKSAEAAEKTMPKTKQNDVVIVEHVTSEDAEDENDTLLTEEPTDQWLQRHLSKLNNANNRLGGKILNENDNVENVGPQQAVQHDQQRKPYNAADYGGKIDSVPKVVTALSPSMQHVEGGGTLDDNGHHRQQAAQPKSQIFTYKNGTTKEVLPDGTTTISFANGDRKRTYANEKKGIVVYYYAATKVSKRVSALGCGYTYTRFFSCQLSSHLQGLTYRTTFTSSFPSRTDNSGHTSRWHANVPFPE